MRQLRAQNHRVWQIGDWTLDEGRQRLIRGDEECSLNPKEMGVLRHLAEAAPDLVSAEDLFTRTWPDVVVGDHVLHEVVARLRKTLGDKARQPTYIETLPKRGYRLLVPVTVVDGSRRDATPFEQRTKRAGAGQWRRWLGGVTLPVALLAVLAWALVSWNRESTGPVARRTVAALPFDTIGNTEAYFSAGITEEILNQMVGVEGVRVISRHSSFLYDDSSLDITEIGRALGADYVLHGSVQRDGGLVRIRVRLMEAANEADVDPLAYDLYLRALQADAANDPFSARRLLEDAIKIDSEFAKAYGLLARTQHQLRAWSERAFVGDDELKRLVDTALRLDPDNVDAQIVQAWRRLWVHFDLQGALDAFESLVRRTHSLLAYRGYTSTLRMALKVDESRAVFETAQRLDPYSIKRGLVARKAALAEGDFNRARRSTSRTAGYQSTPS